MEDINNKTATENKNEEGSHQAAREDKGKQVIVEDSPTVVLRSCDKHLFTLEQSIAFQSAMIKNIVEDGCTVDDAIPLPNVTSGVLSKVIEYWRRHHDVKEDKEDKEALKDWEAEFVDGMDMDMLSEMILAANYLESTSLIALTCQTVADIIKNTTVEEVRDTFHVENDFTREEEAEIRRQSEWAFE